MTRLPTPGGDDGNWGDILNAYLEVSLASDGTLNNNVVGTNQIQNNAVTNAKLDNTTQANLTAASTAVQSVNGKTGTSISLAASDVSAVPTSQLGAASGVATLDSGSHLTASQLPSSVVSSVQLVVNVKNYGATGDGVTDDTTAIQAADTVANALGLPATVFFPAGTYIFSTTLTTSCPWRGLPRQSILQQAASFTYTGYATQFSVRNKHFQDTYNSTTADDISIVGVDFVINPGSVSGKGSVGLANVSGGEIRDCHFTTIGSNPVGSLLDVYACVREFTIAQIYAVNSTQGASGGCLWVRNLTSDGSTSANATENITVRDSYFGQTSGDEAVAVFGSIGMTRRVRIQNCVIEALTSTHNHNYLVSTFPLSHSGANVNAAVDDVQWIGCTFIDTNGTLSSRMFKFGDASDTANICQNIRAINCSFYAQTATASNSYSACINIPCAFDGGSSGNALINCYIDTVGSGQPFKFGINGFDKVISPTLVGNITIGINNSANVLGGSVEASTQGCYNCPNVESLRINFSGATGTACYLDNANSSFISFKGCVIMGGQALLHATSGVTSGVHIEVKNNLMNTTATSGNVVSVPSSSPPRVRLTGNTTFGGTVLTSTGTIADSEANDWYGTTDMGTLSTGIMTVTTGTGALNSIAAPAGTIVGTTDTETLSNKRISRRVVPVTQSATPAINTDNTDVASITGLAQAITSMTTNLTGTPNSGDLLLIQITDDGSPRAITWGASFESTTIILPATTVTSTMLRIGLEWNVTASKWDCIAVA